MCAGPNCTGITSLPPPPPVCVPSHADSRAAGAGGACERELQCAQGGRSARLESALAFPILCAARLTRSSAQKEAHACGPPPVLAGLQKCADSKWRKDCKFRRFHSHSPLAGAASASAASAAAAAAAAATVAAAAAASFAFTNTRRLAGKRTNTTHTRLGCSLARWQILAAHKAALCLGISRQRERERGNDSLRLQLWRSVCQLEARRTDCSESRLRLASESHRQAGRQASEAERESGTSGKIDRDRSDKEQASLLAAAAAAARTAQAT